MMGLNPQVIGATFLAFVLGCGGMYIWGRHDGKAIEAGRQMQNAELIRQVEAAAQRAAASEIAKIEIKNVTIKQKAETVTREVPVYRECTHDALGMQLVNEALTPPARPTGSR